ncbi:MAG TPA: hypothetical protein ENL03_03275, partial [Phycisphaerae bacterium]|nr:hypothetical protein [Phycisphaerae bacterium]
DWLKAGKLRPGEIVTAVLPLQYIDADSASTAVVRMVSSWGSITRLPQGKGIIITDSVGNIEKIRQFIGLLDVSSAGKQQLKTFNLKHASASAVAKIVKGIFASSAQKKVAFNPQTNRYETVTTTPAMVSVTADERTNSIILLGGGEKLAMIEAVITKLDELGDQQSGDMKIFILKNAKAVDLAPTVQAAFSSGSSSPSSRTYRDRWGRTQQIQGNVAAGGSVKIIPDMVTNRLIVVASVDLMDKISKMITDLDDATVQEGSVKIIALKVADAQQLVAIITNAVSKKDPSGRTISSLIVSADERTNSLVLSGPASDIATAADLVGKLDEKSPEQAREIHVIRLTSGKASDIAGTLSRLFDKQASQSKSIQYGRWGRSSQTPSSSTSGSGPKIEAENSTNTLIISASPADWPLLKKILDELKLDSVLATTTKEIVLKHAISEEVAQSLNAIYAAANQRSQSPQYSRSRRPATSSSSSVRATGPSGSPIIIVAVKRNNSLLISAA